MSLSIVATPIGNLDDITLRAIQALKKAEVIIGEEFRETTTLLKRLDIPKPQIERLNEHSSSEEVDELFELCKTKEVALISDCGTPGFCDPGALLVKMCRQQNVSVIPIPGASSLMTLLSVSGHKMGSFIFRGFLPAKKELRSSSLAQVIQTKEPQIIMDTPYRLSKLLSELSEKSPQRQALLGLNMTQENEEYIEDSLKRLANRFQKVKAEFVLILF